MRSNKAHNVESATFWVISAVFIALMGILGYLYRNNQALRKEKVIQTLQPTPQTIFIPVSSYKPLSTPLVSPKQIIYKVPSSTPQLANLVELCETDAASFKSESRLAWDTKMIQEKNKYSDSVMKAAFENLMMQSLEQYLENINNITNSRKTWCIEHNRNYLGFVSPEIKYEVPFDQSIPSPMSECMIKHNCTYGCSASDSDVEYILNTIDAHQRELNISIVAGGYQQNIWQEALKTDYARYESYCGNLQN